MFFHLLSQPTVPINTSLSSQHTSYRLQLIKGQKCHTAFQMMEADLRTFSTNHGSVLYHFRDVAR